MIYIKPAVFKGQLVLHNTPHSKSLIMHCTVTEPKSMVGREIILDVSADLFPALLKAAQEVAAD